MQRIFYLLTVLMILSFGIAAQNVEGTNTGEQPAPAGEYGFDLWTTENGLPQNTVTGVAQTPDGYLWLTTFDGLARFDGVRFTIFNNGNTKGIVNNRFSNIFVDRDGAVWAFTEGGALTLQRNGIFSSYLPTDGSIGPVVSIFRHQEGNAVIETREHYYSLHDGKFILTPDQKADGVSQIYFGRSGAKWISEANGVTCQLLGQTTIYPMGLSPWHLAESASTRPFEDSRGHLWGRSSYSGLFRLHDGIVTNYTENELPGLTDSMQSPFLEDAQGDIWFLLTKVFLPDPSRLVRFHNGSFTSWPLKEHVDANGALIDREGNFWFSTVNGLRRLRRQLITTLSVKDGLNSDEVYPLLQTAGGEFLIGTVSGINGYSGTAMRSLGLKYPTGVPLYMRGMWQDPQGRIWLGYHAGFGRLENGVVHEMNPRSIASGATDFTADREGNTWVATGEGIFTFKDDKETANYTTADGLPHNEVITVHADRSGNIWAGTFDGLAKFQGGRFVDLNHESGSPRGFVRAIYEDADGVLWFGTYGDGLVRYKDGKFFNYRVEDGLSNNGVFAILEDDGGNLWMSSNRGIHRVGKQELNDFADGRIPKINSISYNQSDGMVNAECNGGRLPAAVKASDGKLWFATMGGVAIVDPRLERTNPSPPPVVIEKVAIDRKAVDEPLLRVAAANTGSAIELNPGQSNLEFTYTGLSMTRSEQTRFKYRLEGLEENWVEAGTARTANYSYVPYGEYTFHVLAANADGVWNNEGALIRIVVHPYFYQTWWFLAIGIICIGLVIWLIYYNRVSHLRAIAETKSAFSQALIASQEAERKRIASELHDGLGQSLVVIKNRAMLGISKGDDPERVAKELGNISESASHALDEVREITNNLRPQLLDRLGLTKAINAMLKKVSGVVEIESEIDNIDKVFGENEEISIYRIMQESLNNIIKHSKASRAVVKIKRTGDRVVITIKDNGEGFNIDGVSAERSGMGLTGMAERAELLKGELSVESTLGKGTLIDLSIPIG